MDIVRLRTALKIAERCVRFGFRGSYSRQEYDLSLGIIEELIPDAVLLSECPVCGLLVNAHRYTHDAEGLVRDYASRKVECPGCGTLCRSYIEEARHD